MRPGGVLRPGRGTARVHPGPGLPLLGVRGRGAVGEVVPGHSIPDAASRRTWAGTSSSSTPGRITRNRPLPGPRAAVGTRGSLPRSGLRPLGRTPAWVDKGLENRPELARTPTGVGTVGTGYQPLCPEILHFRTGSQVPALAPPRAYKERP